MCKGLSIDDVGVVRRDTVFQEILERELGFETGDFVRGKLGGKYRRTTPGRLFRASALRRINAVTRITNVRGTPDYRPRIQWADYLPPAYTGDPRCVYQPNRSAAPVAPPITLAPNASEPFRCHFFPAAHTGDTSLVHIVLALPLLGSSARKNKRRPFTIATEIPSAPSTREVAPQRKV